MALLQLDHRLSAIQSIFGQLYGTTPRFFRAPGRVNLIGEHTDYNDGFVMPAALEFCTIAAASPRGDRKLKVFSESFQEPAEFDLDAIEPKPMGHWSDYVRGVAGVLQSKGHTLRGINLMLSSDVPVGAGLSSSAALEVSVAAALLGISGIEMPLTEVALVCQKAEHVYSGTMCGIMDQYISCLGKAGHALLIDCRSLENELQPLDENVELVICNTNVKHELANGEYNLRRESCHKAVAILQQKLPGMKALRDIPLAELEVSRPLFDELTYRRARHVVSENERVMAAATALKTGDLEEFGRLMYASHKSLSEDYEVSCEELDLLVKLATDKPGVYGSRMTGGGFGGCTVSLVAFDQAESFAATMAAEYEKACGRKASVYICNTGDGVLELK